MNKKFLFFYACHQFYEMGLTLAVFIPFWENTCLKGLAWCSWSSGLHMWITWNGSLCAAEHWSHTHLGWWVFRVTCSDTLMMPRSSPRLLLWPELPQNNTLPASIVIISFTSAPSAASNTPLTLRKADACFVWKLCYCWQEQPNNQHSRGLGILTEEGISYVFTLVFW